MNARPDPYFPSYWSGKHYIQRICERSYELFTRIQIFYGTRLIVM